MHFRKFKKKPVHLRAIYTQACLRESTISIAAIVAEKNISQESFALRKACGLHPLLQLRFYAIVVSI
jgi:hypothetical protein